MPFGDGTGPWGEGPMTGRGLGSCADIEVSQTVGHRGPEESYADVNEQDHNAIIGRDAGNEDERWD